MWHPTSLPADQEQADALVALVRLLARQAAAEAVRKEHADTEPAPSPTTEIAE